MANISRNLADKEVVRTETVPDGFNVHLTDDELRVLRFLLASVYLDRSRFTSDITGVQRLVETAHELENQFSLALERARVTYKLSPFVMEPR